MSGRSVVVTGANSGIGLATAIELATAGYRVLGTVRSDPAAQALAAAAQHAGVQIEQVTAELDDETSLDLAFAQIAELTDGGPWAVVNNAGYAQVGTVEEVALAAARAQLELNLLVPARIAQLVLPAMRRRGDGRIVNISSVAGRMSLPMMGWYCASKHALEALTDALRIEVAQFGVRVTLVEPGSFRTNIWSGARLPDLATSSSYSGAHLRAHSAASGAQRWLPDPIWVARTVRYALATPIPLARYLVGVDAIGGVLAERLVPTAVLDLVKAKVAGVQ